MAGAFQQLMLRCEEIFFLFDERVVSDHSIGR